MNELKEIIAMLPEGWLSVAIIVALILIDRLITKKRLEEKFQVIGEGIGVAISVFLRSKFGAKVENAIELRIVKIKEIVDCFLMGLIIGLRKDNEEKEEAKSWNEDVKDVNQGLEFDIRHLRGK